MKKLSLLITTVIFISCTKQKHSICSTQTVEQDGITYYLSGDLTIRDKDIRGKCLILDKQDKVIGVTERSFLPLPDIRISSIPKICFIIK